ncbi:MAG: accessory factor UbiK family protein [Rickettsiales bacterium]
MQKDSKFFEDVAKLTSGAAGVFMDMKREVESMVADCLERFMAKERFVTREEFEAVKAMAQKAREENEALKAELEKMKG